MKNGVDGLELDIRMTKDKQPVIFHDKNLLRMTGVNSNISDFDYKDLPKLSEKTSLHFSYNGFYDVKPEIDSRRIPLMEVTVFKYSLGLIQNS